MKKVPMLANRLSLALAAVIGVPALLVGYIALAEYLVSRLAPVRRAQVRPWLWIAPALILVTVYLIYPVINTIILSFQNANSTQWVGLDNYIYFFTNGNTLTAFKNSALWLVFLTAFTVTIGFLLAVLFDRLPPKLETTSKAIVFLPMAISFVAAGVIWRLQYAYNPPGSPQTGTLNAILATFGAAPIAWLVNRTTNNAALIAVGIWMWVGFALVILSAGLKGISKEVLEAARVDGANEWQLFWRIITPMMGSTIAVVATTMVITALKAFDIVYVMTSGNYGTDVIANRMYTEMFNIRNFGRASAVAVVLLLTIIPVMIVNIRRFRAQEAIR
jgi:alpha-glucoside transport system permease protein